ncbi:hypothetical protein [Naasia aerilata]|uniref:Uncharacterized protein n=1 Tax=Naasia aerilata TaxID=1162966 RepID=A0ABM8GF12_9MICO|nr:hypothetical protein [Naasia aerilata]BDZ46908.1 hypothetical protein GCM10025866_28170 [Naasia aerilata]
MIGAVIAVPIAALAWETVKVWDEPHDGPSALEARGSAPPS